MAKKVADLMKSTVDASLDELVRDIWGEEAVDEVQPDVAEEDQSAEVQRMSALLNRIFGIREASKMVGEPMVSVYKLWMTGEESPNGWQLRFMRHAYEITALLMMTAKKPEVRFWWVNRNEYLGGYVPSSLFPRDPMGVRMAAMDYLMNVKS